MYLSTTTLMIIGGLVGLAHARTSDKKDNIWLTIGSIVKYALMIVVIELSMPLGWDSQLTKMLSSIMYGLVYGILFHFLKVSYTTTFSIALQKWTFILYGIGIGITMNCLIAVCNYG